LLDLQLLSLHSLVHLGLRERSCSAPNVASITIKLQVRQTEGFPTLAATGDHPLDLLCKLSFSGLSVASSTPPTLVASSRGGQVIAGIAHSLAAPHHSGLGTSLLVNIDLLVGLLSFRVLVRPVS
jgi:hypothetical protein